MQSPNRLTALRNGHIICSTCLECIDCGLCKCGKAILDFRHLEHAIQTMTIQSKLFRIIKSEITKRGHWKQLPRGKK